MVIVGDMSFKSKEIHFLPSILQGKTLGEFSKDKFKGDFMDTWRSALKGTSFEKVRQTVKGMKIVELCICPAYMVKVRKNTLMISKYPLFLHPKTLVRE